MVDGVFVEHDAGLPSATTALRDVSLSIGSEETVAVIGPTGSGKTTLLEVASGLTGPTAGTVSVDGDTGAAVRSHVGLVYQFPEFQFFEETVLDDVAFGPRRQGLAGEELTERVSGALERAQLSPDDFLDRSPLSLSAGEKRRVAIACILALGRPFLLLDEPTAGLDPVTRRGIIDLVRAEAAAGRGVTIVTHDLDVADAVASRVVVLSEGCIVADSTPEALFGNSDLLGGLGLCAPHRYELVDSVRRRSPEAADRVEGILL